MRKKFGPITIYFISGLCASGSFGFLIFLLPKIGVPFWVTPIFSTIGIMVILITDQVNPVPILRKAFVTGGVISALNYMSIVVVLPYAGLLLGLYVLACVLVGAVIFSMIINSWMSSWTKSLFQ